AQQVVPMNANPATAHLFIMNPLSMRTITRLFSTHPPTQERVRRAVKLGLTAYTLEWDGHVQAMTGRREFWSGTGTLTLRQPTVRLVRTPR
ncbi:MAG: hypothetical protein AAB289_12670, partial [Chloroflexota bacterium]